MRFSALLWPRSCWLDLNFMLALILKSPPTLSMDTARVTDVNDGLRSCWWSSSSSTLWSWSSETLAGVELLVSYLIGGHISLLLVCSWPSDGWRLSEWHSSARSNGKQQSDIPSRLYRSHTLRFQFSTKSIYPSQSSWSRESICPLICIRVALSCSSSCEV